MKNKLWLVFVIILLAAAAVFAFVATGHTYFAALLAFIAPVSYTHLDVYKRQALL